MLYWIDYSINRKTVSFFCKKAYRGCQWIGKEIDVVEERTVSVSFIFNVITNTLKWNHKHSLYLNKVDLLRIMQEQNQSFHLVVLFSNYMMLIETCLALNHVLCIIHSLLLMFMYCLSVAVPIDYYVWRKYQYQNGLISKPNNHNLTPSLQTLVSVCNSLPL